MEYWLEEPPTHVILALRYLGQRKSAKTEQQAKDQLAQAMEMVGQGVPAPLPQHLRDLADWAEQEKQKRKGLKNGRKS